MLLRRRGARYKNVLLFVVEHCVRSGLQYIARGFVNDKSCFQADMEIEKIVLQTLQWARKERELLRRKVENANSYLQV